jgi:antitoxin (DNA-binding transcriptional repressor) of toxin-antitoxin stability system
MRSEIRIAEFKSQVSRYVRAAQRGNEIVIKDRDTPVARLGPYVEQAGQVPIKPPVGSLRDLAKLARFKPKKLKLRDLNRALREERREGFDPMGR